MKRALAVVGLLFCGLLLTAAITNPSQLWFTASGTGAVQRKVSAKLSDVVNVKDFGAVGDGVTDDTAAINAAFNYVRASAQLWQEPVSNYQYRMVTVNFPGGRYKVTSINATGLRDFAWTIRGEGAVIFGTGAGNVVLDMTWSRAGKVEGIAVYGDNAAPPRVGIQIGRTSSSASADNLLFDNVSSMGTFTLAALYNAGSEDSVFQRVQLINQSSAASTFALVQDGANHWGITSAYQAITWTPDTAGSFNGNVFVMLDARRGTSGGPAIWMSRTEGHKYIRSYVATYLTEAIDIYNETFGNQDLDMDLHTETNTVISNIKMLGTNLTPLLRGFRYSDYAPQATTQIFDLSAITTVTFEGAWIDLPQYTTTPTNGIFNPKANAKFNGNIYTGAGGNLPNLAQQGGWIQVDNRALPSYGPGSYYITDTTNTDAAFKGTFRFYDTSSTNVAPGSLGGSGTTTISGGTVTTSAACSGCLTQEGWNAPTLGNSWANFGGAAMVAGYFKDTLGVIHLRGSIKSGTLGAAAFTLPAGYVPSANVNFVAKSSLYCEVQVASSGAVNPGVNATCNNAIVSLDGISFDTR